MRPTQNRIELVPLDGGAEFAVSGSLPMNRAVLDLENFELFKGYARSRGGSRLGQTNEISGSSIATGMYYFDMPGGEQWIIVVLEDGSISVKTSFDPANNLVTSALGSALSAGAGAIAFRDRIWMTDSASWPLRLFPAGDRAPLTENRFQYAGCFAPLPDDDDHAILFKVVDCGVAGEGLDAGVYYYGVTLGYGVNGSLGFSALGAVTRVVVPPSLDGRALVRHEGSSQGLPVIGGSYIPNDERYIGATVRRLWRTYEGAGRSGYFHWISDYAGMESSEFEDQLADEILTDETFGRKLTADDPRLPPMTRYISMHDRRALWAGGTNYPTSVFYSDVEKPDLVGRTSKFEVGRGHFDPIRGVGPVGNQSVVFTRRAMHGLIPGPSGSIGIIEEGIGLLADQSLASGPAGLRFLSDLGPLQYNGSSIEFIGGEDKAKRVMSYLRRYCMSLDRVIGHEHGDRYYLSYGDIRDEATDSHPWTRALVFYGETGGWGKVSGAKPGFMASAGGGLWFTDSRGDTELLRFTEEDVDDYDPIAADVQAIIAMVRFGNMLPSGVGRETPPKRWSLSARIPGPVEGESVQVIPIHDGVEQVPVDLVSETGGGYEPFSGALERSEGEELHLVVQNTGTVGRWEIRGAGVDLTERES